MPGSIQATTILNKTKRRDPWFLDDYTLNPYSGCSFNCLFCYIRGSRYGINMAEKLSVKANAVELLEKQLRNRARKGQYGIIVLSSATDPYLQLEEKYRLTRQLLEVILHYRFPLHVITRSQLVARDFDLLQAIDREALLPADLLGRLKSGALLTFSFSTLDDAIAHIFEPGATPPSARLQTLQQALAQGLHSGVSMMPLLPYITDTAAQLESMYQSFSAAGARYLFPATLTLYGGNPADSRTLVLRAVEKHYPQLLEKYRRFFGESGEMPAYYREALYRKCRELGERYGIADRIV